MEYVPWNSANTRPVIWATSKMKTTRKSDFVENIAFSERQEAADDDNDEGSGGGGLLSLSTGVRRILRADALWTFGRIGSWWQSVCLEKTEKERRTERNRRRTTFSSPGVATTWRGSAEGSRDHCLWRPSDRPIARPSRGRRRRTAVGCNTQPMLITACYMWAITDARARPPIFDTDIRCFIHFSIYLWMSVCVPSCHSTSVCV